ncbi:MAG TPA: DUF4085 family protein, partial [Mobilitalea sp.]|nr:DUF4085 family protein [Mobilitalea sp.]
MVNQDGEFVDAADYLSKEELERIREGIRREEQEAYNNFVPEVYDEEVLTKQFHVNILNERVKQLKAILPEDIQKDIADIRVLAFDEASEDIYKRILEFCLHKEERALKIEQDCQNYYDSIAEQLPENIRKKYGFHDCRVINFEQNGTDAILELDQRGGYSNVCKVIFHNAEVLEQEDIAGSWWLYQEIYLRDGLYEFHAMLHDENGVLRYLTLTAADVEFVKDGE